MKKFTFAFVFLVYITCFGCTDLIQGETHVEWVTSQFIYTPSFINGGDQVTYYYHYFDETVEIDNPTYENENHFEISKYSIEILNTEQNKYLIATIAGMHKTNNSNNNRLNKGSVLAFYIFFNGSCAQADISIKFYNKEIFSGTVYRYKETHNKTHN